jgi:hypothetical protein
MAYDVSVFVRGCGRDAILKLLRERLHTETTIEETRDGALWVSNVFGVRLAVVDGHGLIDDCGISFTQYPLQVSLTLYAGRIPIAGPQLCRALARVFASVACAAGAECLIVEELQRVLDGASGAA